MKVWFKNKRWYAGIACLAILLNALAPTLSHALAANQVRSDSGSWNQICWADSHHASALQASTDASAISADDSTHHSPTPGIQHCPFCSLHAGQFALPAPTALIALPPAPASAAAPNPQWAAHHPFLWTSAHPRAPPAQL